MEPVSANTSLASSVVYGNRRELKSWNKINKIRKSTQDEAGCDMTRKEEWMDAMAGMNESFKRLRKTTYPADHEDVGTILYQQVCNLDMIHISCEHERCELVHIVLIATRERRSK